MATPMFRSLLMSARLSTAISSRVPSAAMRQASIWSRSPVLTPVRRFHSSRLTRNQTQAQNTPPKTAAPEPPAESPILVDSPRSAMMYRLAVGGVVAYIAFVGWAAYDGHLSLKAKQAAEDAVKNIPLYQGNPVVFFDFEVDGKPAGRVIIQLRKDVAPIAAENFRQLCLGTRGYGYKGTRIHAVIPGQYIAGGDYQFGTGEGGASIYGRPFPDEDTKLRHIGPGVLSMASLTPNENGSLFMFTMAKAPIHDHRYMAFGNVMSGIEVLRSLEQLGSWRGDVQSNVRIADCGELTISKDDEAAAIAVAEGTKALPPSSETNQ